MANEKLKRGKPSSKRASLHDANDYAYNDAAGAFKVLGPILGALNSLGAANTAKGLGVGKLVALYNDSAVTAWAKTGTSAVGVPAAGDIALAPLAYTIISLGDNDYVRASAATVYAYEIIDDTVYTP